MRFRLKIACWTGLGLVLLGLLGRALWLVSQTETGLQTLQQHWIDATLGSVFREQTPIYAREPIDQAEFWLGEVERVRAANPHNAAYAIGAALVLDCPAPGFVGKYIKGYRTFPGGGQMPNLDDEEIRRAYDAFEHACRRRCLELAASATELDPANVEWQRLGALLLWRHSWLSQDSNPRDPNWQAILDGSALHDPDNAFYDYLAAYFYWESSAEIDYSGDVERLIIKDRATFDRGTAYFRRGQKKPLFAVGDAGYPATAEFLSKANIPLVEHPYIVNGRSIHIRRSMLLRTVARWQGRRADAAGAADDYQAALAMHRENHRMFEQFAATGKSSAYDNTLLACRNATTSQMMELATKYRDELSADQLQEIETICERASVDRAVVQNAALLLAGGNQQRAMGMTFNGDPWDVALAMAVSSLTSIVFASALLAAAATLLALYLPSQRRFRVGIAEHVLMLLAAVGVTATVFGFAPAGIIDQQLQAWGLTIAVLMIPVALVSWAAWAWLRPNHFQYSLRSLFVAFFVVSLLLTLVALIRPIVVSFASFPFQLKIPALGWGGWDASVLELAFRQLGSWLWAACQWTLYLGPYLTIAIWACFVATLLQLKSQFERREDDQTPPILQDHLHTLGEALRTPSLVLAALALFAYLLLVPRLIHITEQQFQSAMAFARQPDNHWTKVEQAVQNVRGDAVLMSEIEDSAQIELSPPAPANQEE